MATGNFKVDIRYDKSQLQMSHRYRIQASKAHWTEIENKTNKFLLKMLGRSVIASLAIYFIVLVATHEFDSNVKMGFEIIGVLFLASFGVYSITRMVKK